MPGEGGLSAGYARRSEREMIQRLMHHSDTYLRALILLEKLHSDPVTQRIVKDAIQDRRDFIDPLLTLTQTERKANAET